MNQQTVHDAEDDRSRCDTNGDDGYGKPGKDVLAAKNTARVPEILDDGFQPRQASRVAVFLFGIAQFPRA